MCVPLAGRPSAAKAPGDGPPGHEWRATTSGGHGDALDPRRSDSPACRGRCQRAALDDPQVGEISLTAGSAAGYALVGKTFTDARSATSLDRGSARLWRFPDGQAWVELEQSPPGSEPLALAMNAAGVIMSEAAPGGAGVDSQFVANGSSQLVSTGPAVRAEGDRSADPLPDRGHRSRLRGPTDQHTLECPP